MWTNEDFESREADSGRVPEVAPSASVALMLSDVLGKEVTDIEPLGNKIDTDALNRLFQRNRDTDLRFEFTHEGCRITVQHDDIDVSSLEPASD